MYSVLNTLSEYPYFYISKKLLNTLLLLVFKVVETLQCILNLLVYKWKYFIYLHFVCTDCFCKIDQTYRLINDCLSIHKLS